MIKIFQAPKQHPYYINISEKEWCAEIDIKGLTGCTLYGSDTKKDIKKRIARKIFIACLKWPFRKLISSVPHINITHILLIIIILILLLK